MNPLHLASKKGQVDELRRLIEEEQYNVELADDVSYNIYILLNNNITAYLLYRLEELL